MITPPYLKKGDKIGIVSSARKVTATEIEPGLDLLRSWGLVPVTGKNLFKEDHQYAGTDAERRADLQEMLDDRQIRAILFARGGYGTVRIIDSLDFSAFLQSPKWIAGYSDITVIHSHLHNLGVETIHSVMLSALASPQGTNAAESLRKAFFGELREYSMPTSYTELQREGEAEGELVGGNLSLLYALTGSASDISTSGKILFLEDLDEYLYHIDRMMINLKRSGKLKNLKGLIIGGMTDMRDNPVPFGKTAEEIVYSAVKEYSYPVCYGFPTGHIDNNHSLIISRRIRLSVKPATASIHFDF